MPGSVSEFEQDLHTPRERIPLVGTETENGKGTLKEVVRSGERGAQNINARLGFVGSKLWRRLSRHGTCILRPSTMQRTSTMDARVCEILVSLTDVIWVLVDKRHAVASGPLACFLFFMSQVATARATVVLASFGYKPSGASENSTAFHTGDENSRMVCRRSRRSSYHKCAPGRLVTHQVAIVWHSVDGMRAQCRRKKTIVEPDENLYMPYQ